MSRESESTFGARMQGPEHEGDTMIALGILNGDEPIGFAMSDRISPWNDCNVDWDYVKRYIADNRRKYPDYREHWTDAEKDALREKYRKYAEEQAEEDRANLVGTVHEDDLVFAKSILHGNFTMAAFKDGEFDGQQPDFKWIENYIALHRHEYPDFKGE